MKALFRFSTIVLLLLLLIGLVLFFAIGYNLYSGTGATLRFVNSSGQQVVEAKVIVAGQSCSVKKLSDEGEFSCRFENLYDSSYKVSVRLQDGVVYSEANLGYVTGGMNFNDVITINKSGVMELMPGPVT